ncbi:hydrolase [Liquorilactobacillus sucicola DSM 21376 = JCM 15457]|uniref:Alpha beta fold family hydrolase n=1 Tax=Liquorilactobacillus sucicola DSM 21376 = JCM 15457 TaxID=1423806 RepID=A0A023CVQ2_9LACO|nr:alpha/beta hydrolase [Liquorilactobacillus sucicola]KRN05575.1 alpha beta fold family hydrolase [Liquorilactobacillus sucicola DSM 21376 = JCM 15457]GAJ25661.1 hydrolase [Liquorilactobacillus sucicola DSM 21376 = JCM 15457]
MQKIIDGVKIHYEIIGQGHPVIFLHGLCLDLNFMKKNYSQLLDRRAYRQIYIDLPGMGESSSFSEPRPSSDFLLNLLLKFIKALKIVHFSICGHSYGGYLALGIAHACPTQVTSLFLSCPVVTANPINRITAKHLNIKNQEFDAAKENKYTPDFIKMNVIVNNLTWKKYLAEIVVGLKKCDFNFINQLQADNYKYYELANEKNIKKWHSETPVFFLMGKHDHVVGYKEQATLAQNFKTSNLLILEDAGHNLPLDQPELFATCVKYFFKQAI